MARKKKKDCKAPLTERDLVPCLFVNEVEIDLEGNIARFVASVTLPYFGGDKIERRIVCRWAMEIGEARGFIANGQKVLGP